MLGLESSGAGTLDWLMRNRATLVKAALPASLGWSVVQHVSYDGGVTIVATQAQTDKTLTLSGEDSDVQVKVLEDDELTSLGNFSSVEAALDAVRTLVGVPV